MQPHRGQRQKSRPEVGVAETNLYKGPTCQMYLCKLKSLWLTNELGKDKASGLQQRAKEVHRVMDGPDFYSGMFSVSRAAETRAYSNWSLPASLTPGSA